jgi:hypothetical protein
VRFGTKNSGVLKFSASFNLCIIVIYDEMGWACGAYGRGERCAQGVGGEA